jgi:hypothetical protein
VEALHAQGVVHRDLKPQNVLVRPNWQPVLMDLGIARALDDDLKVTPAGQVVGTPLYIPPEVLSHGEPTTRGDLHSMGVMLYVFLAGRPPYVGSSMPELVDSILNDPVESLGRVCPELPRPLVDAVDRLLARDPERRPADVAALRGLLGFEPSPQPAPSLAVLEQEPPRVGRSREIEYFRVLLKRWVRGGTHVLSLRGAAGSGKSRLLRSFAATARAHGPRALRTEVTTCLPDAPRVALAVLPRLAGLSGGEDEPAPPLGTVEELLSAALPPGGPPTLLLVDGLEDADPQTLDVLSRAVQRGRAGELGPLILVLASPDAGLVDVVARGAPVRNMELGPLDAVDLRRLIVPDDRERPDTQEILSELMRASGGLPGRVRDAIWDEAASGKLSRDGDRWRVAVHGSVELRFGPPLDPRGCPLESVIGWVLELGLPLPLPLLLSSAPADPEVLLATITRGVASGALQVGLRGNQAWLLHASSGTHVVPSPEEATELHSRAARWLTLHLPGGGLGDESVGEHWARAGEHRRAAVALRRAATANAALGLDGDALRLLRLVAHHERLEARNRARQQVGAWDESATDIFERRDRLRALRRGPGERQDRFR